MGLVWFILGCLTGGTITLGWCISYFYENKFKEDSNYIRYCVWYKIEHFVDGCMGEQWYHSLHNGKPSSFPRLTDAFLALTKSPDLGDRSIKYRIVRVTEEIVNERLIHEGRTSGRAAGAKGFAGDGGKQRSGEQNIGEVASQGRSV